jgi:hypothetical protein
MPDEIFLSYSQANRRWAERLVGALESHGWSVWWDPQIPAGETWAEAIEQALKGASCVLALWSGNSVNSKWVKKEARYAERHGKLVPILIEKVEPPFEFEHLQALNLAHWSGEDSPNFQALVIALAERMQGADGGRLPVEEAAKLMQEHAKSRRAQIGLIEKAPTSLFGTNSYRARITNGKGVIYCHVDGKLRRQTFYVRKGIGWFYETVIGGASSRLGLPVSNEEVVDGTGYPTSYFEGGYIEWSSKTEVTRAVIYTPEGDRTFLEQKL